MNEHKEPIPSMIYNASVGGHVTNSQQIIDENENKEQSQINSEVKQILGQGGSIDNRINKTKNDIIGGASSNGDTLKKLEDRVSPIESAVNIGGDIDKKIETAVNIEKTRAEEKESTLDDKITTEKTRAEEAERDLDKKIDTLETIVGPGDSVNSRISNAVAKETTRAQNAESTLQTNIDTEIIRAQTVEEQLRTLYNNLQQSKPIPITELPDIGEEGKIYRLAGITSYSDYMWNNSQFVKMATYNNAIDNKPIAESENLVKSSGVFTAIEVEKNRAEAAEQVNAQAIAEEKATTQKKLIKLCSEVYGNIIVKDYTTVSGSSISAPFDCALNSGTKVFIKITDESNVIDDTAPSVKFVAADGTEESYTVDKINGRTVTLKNDCVKAYLYVSGTYVVGNGKVSVSIKELGSGILQDIEKIKEQVSENDISIKELSGIVNGDKFEYSKDYTTVSGSSISQRFDCVLTSGTEVFIKITDDSNVISLADPSVKLVATDGTEESYTVSKINGRTVTLKNDCVKAYLYVSGTYVVGNGKVSVSINGGGNDSLDKRINQLSEDVESLKDIVEGDYIQLSSTYITTQGNPISGYRSCELKGGTKVYAKVTDNDNVLSSSSVSVTFVDLNGVEQKFAVAPNGDRTFIVPNASNKYGIYTSGSNVIGSGEVVLNVEYGEIGINGIKEELKTNDIISSQIFDEIYKSYRRYVEFVNESTQIFSLGFVTDVHDLLANIVYLNKANDIFGCNLLVNGGDIVLASNDDFGTIGNLESSRLMNVSKYMASNTPWLFAKGNHERSYSNILLGNVFNKSQQRVHSNLVLSEDGCYGYKDDENSRIRTYVLNTTDASLKSHFGMTDAQLQWFANTLSEIESGWNVIVITHVCAASIGSTDNSTMFPTFRAIMEGFNTKSSGISGNVSWDFTNISDSIIICNLCGHTHYNLSTIENGVRYITRQGPTYSTTSKEGATYDMVARCCFDIFVVKDRVAKIFRIGAGGELRDLEFDY